MPKIVKAPVRAVPALKSELLTLDNRSLSNSFTNWYRTYRLTHPEADQRMDQEGTGNRCRDFSMYLRLILPPKDHFGCYDIDFVLFHQTPQGQRKLMFLEEKTLDHKHDKFQAFQNKYLGLYFIMDTVVSKAIRMWFQMVADVDYRGFHVLCMDGTFPGNSKFMELDGKEITLEELTKFLQMDVL